MKKLYVAMVVATAAVLAGTPAFAVDPTPPDPAASIGTVLANFGDKLVSTVMAVAANTWVLALFALGIAFGIARRVLHKGEKKVGKAVG